MNSSTFSFRREVPVWLAVGLTFLVAEIAFRAAGPRMSDNLARTDAIPRQAQRLAASPNRPRVLVLGNSLTIRGIDEPALAREAAAVGRAAPKFEIVALFAAELSEWFWIVHQQFASREKMPDAVVLNVDDDFIRDLPSVQARRLALYFPPLSKPFVPTEDIPMFEQRAEFVIARFSHAFSRAKNLGSVALARLLPFGEEGSEWTRIRIANRRKQDAGNVASSPTFERLERLLKLAKEKNARAVCVLMPHRERYEVAREFHEIVRAHDALVVDARDVAGIGPEDFADQRHLNEAGAAKFTPEYARRLMAALAPLDPPPTVGDRSPEAANESR